MQDSTFIGLDVHKATISVAVAHGERGGEVRHWGRFHTGQIMFESWWRNWQQDEADCISVTRLARAVMACIASLSKWAMIASWWRLRSFR